MFVDCRNHANRGKFVAVLLLAAMWAAPASLYADKKKKKAAPAPVSAAPVAAPTFSDVVFPPAPAVTRMKYLDYFSYEKVDLPKEKKEEKKAGWMDRLAGVSPDAEKGPGVQKKRFQLLEPYGVAVDSKGLLYVADTKVGAIFIFNTENNDLTLIKHGVDGHFKALFGLVMDDNDSLLVSDGEAHHVLVFDSKHKLQTSFGEGEMQNPNGMAIDFDNRFLYVADAGLDQILVYDADSYKLLRRLGTTGKNHTLTDIGNFSKPTNVAVDKDGNVYITDTLNDRVEVFDADGNFVRTWGKNGDGPGDFARPKGITVDCDGHIWVADAMLNRIQVFTPEGQLLMAVGGFGILPGQFEALTALAFDKKNNRIFTSEQLLGRVQMYRYFTNAEAKAAIEKRQEDLKKKAEERNGTKPVADSATSPATTPASTGAPEKSGGAMKLPDPPAAQAAPAAAAPPTATETPVKSGGAMKLPDPPAQAAPASAK
jgi:DNA-binding beta-propeller fold protein YncE